MCYESLLDFYCCVAINTRLVDQIHPTYSLVTYMRHRCKLVHMGILFWALKSYHQAAFSTGVYPVFIRVRT